MLENKLNIRENSFLCILRLLFFQIPLQRMFSLFQYFDEIITILVLVIYIMDILKKNKIIINVKIFNILIMIILFILFGLFGNFKYKLHHNTYAMFLGLFLYLKPFIIFFMGINLMRSFKLRIPIIVKKITRIFKAYTLIMLLFAILNLLLNSFISKYAIDMGMTHDFRYGLPNFKFLYTAAGEIGIITTLMAAFFKINKERKYLIMALFLDLLSFRGTSIGLIGVYILLSILFHYKSKLKLKHLLFVSPIAFLFGWNQIRDYFILGDDTARYNLLKYSFVNAHDFFPLGSGFATYGSAPAKMFYSPLYVKYNFNSVWGLSAGFGEFLTDSFWPMVIGELGVFGSFFYMLSIILMFKFIIKGSIDEFRFSILFIIAMICILSISSSIVLVGNYSVIIFFVLAIIHLDNDYKRLYQYRYIRSTK